MIMDNGGSGRGSVHGGKSHRKVVAIVVAIIVVLVAWAGYRLIDGYLHPDVAAVDDTINVTVADATVGDVEVTSVHTGKITADNEVNVVPKIAGRATSVNVELGQKVDEGDVLFMLDPSDVEAQQAQAEIQRDAASKGRSSASSAVATAQEAVDDAKAAVKDAKKGVKDAKAALKKAKKLPSAPTAGLPGATPGTGQTGQAGQTATSPVAAAEQLVAQAEAALAQAKAGQKQAEAGLTQARSGYDQADAQYRLANEGVNSAGSAIGEMTVRAPIDGYVTGLTVQRGGMVSQAMPAAVITGTGKIQVRTTVAESLVGGLVKGEPVEVFVRAVSDEPFPAKISRIVPAPPTGQTTYPIIIEFDMPSEELKPGMFAEVEMVTAKAQGAVTVPSDAVIIRGGKEVVVVMDGADRVRVREVVTGIDDGVSVVIDSGVAAGERVVTEGQHYVNDDTKVRVAS
ncbi:MAG: efflux RND transporter periplasmic adaptor subunit [Clostridiales Family XIII bacterium]|jgi:RND family efflux transporter MFP subunit|nr:efflux RND transporter periplasmic adaptor subunit [Clostridiales Family XIII bacterium]